MHRARLTLLVVASLAAGLVGFEAQRVARDLSRTRQRHGAAYAGSAACGGCHPTHESSWHATFHRTMTAEAGPESVVGRFDGRAIRYLGLTVTMDRDTRGAYRMTFTDGARRVVRCATVARTVGSHRFQQYLARDDDLYVRLPVAWSVDDGRFFPMNGAFLTADPPPRDTMAATLADFDRHVTRWNDNCVFCHNVAPDPALDASGRFHTRTAELGVACESCHGPGAEHVAVNADPVRRATLWLGHLADPTITNPRRLSPLLSADVCGRCHGQRITENVGAFLAQGDPFVAGDDLATESAPLWRDTELHGDDTAFAPRFWSDGTPRLTAYEYQGLLLSRCTQGGLTCTSCHGMHEGDPRGQVRPIATGDAACTGCHHGLATDAAVARHSGHRVTSSGARCVGCHMPRVVYGLVGARISHRIELPDPTRHRPDACTNCHADETRAWALDGMRRLFARPADDGGAREEAGLSHLERALFAGDPVTRALAADALGREGVTVDAAHRRQRLGALLTAMESDPYPAVRRIAWRAARSLAPQAPLSSYEATATLAERTHLVAQARVATTAPTIDPVVVARLQAEASTQAIEIGE